MEGLSSAAESATNSPPDALGLPALTDSLTQQCTALLERHFGFRTLRPLQDRALAAGIAGRDSLVVLPTGGGKSLCYQLPPLVTQRLDVVVSPLISLMKDQVDGLRALGYPAAALHSQSDDDDRRSTFAAIREERLRLLFVSPERLLQPVFTEMLRFAQVRAIAIDEAHCISQWGHDFRPEYRRLSELRDRFPDASMHAFTATATPRVRADIIHQLRLRTPAVIVGSCDRPNLVFRVLQQRERAEMVKQVLERHRGEPGIVYCMSRKETEQTAQRLKQDGFAAGCYHAMLPQRERMRTQESFADERLDIVVATVAFGMGIDRSNVRFVVHTSMPKSIEQYQQEAGRAGRDGLEAECVLLHRGDEVPLWRRMLLSADPPPDPASLRMQMEQVHAMARFCLSVECRHTMLRRHFGELTANDVLPPCGACDVCLGETRAMPGAQVIAQKILSCVARMGQSFGAKRVTDVLRGMRSADVLDAGHDRLSTFGLLRDIDAATVQSCIRQLVAHGLLVRSDGDRPVLLLSPAARSVMRGEREVTLLDARRTLARRSDAERQSWADVDRDLFDRLRAVRRELAESEGRPPFMIFADTSLRDMARLRPDTLQALRTCHGVGDAKLERYGEAFLEAIRQWSTSDAPAPSA